MTKKNPHQIQKMPRVIFSLLFFLLSCPSSSPLKPESHVLHHWPRISERKNKREKGRKVAAYDNDIFVSYLRLKSRIDGERKGRKKGKDRD